MQIRANHMHRNVKCLSYISDGDQTVTKYGSAVSWTWFFSRQYEAFPWYCKASSYQAHMHTQQNKPQTCSLLCAEVSQCIIWYKAIKIMHKKWMSWNCVSFENLTQASSLFSTQDVRSHVKVTSRLEVRRPSTAHPYMQISVNFNNLVK
jgi:hypothetical protein